MTIFGDRTFKEVLRVKEVIRVALTQCDWSSSSRKKFGYKCRPRDDTPCEETARGAFCQPRREAWVEIKLASTL